MLRLVLTGSVLDDSSCIRPLQPPCKEETPGPKLSLKSYLLVLKSPAPQGAPSLRRAPLPDSQERQASPLESQSLPGAFPSPASWWGLLWAPCLAACPWAQEPRRPPGSGSGRRSAHSTARWADPCVQGRPVSGKDVPGD